MATVTGFTSQRMLEIENNTVVDGNIVGDDLILTTFGGTDINAGNVRGPQGIQGPIGEVSQASLDAQLAAFQGGTGNLADGAVTTPKLANDAVTQAKIGPGAVTGTEIANDAVDNQHIANGAVQNAQLGADAVTASKLADNSVGSEHIQTNAVGASEIATGAVGTTQLAADAVTGAKIGNDQINSEHYVAGSIDAEHLANNSVTESKILNGSVTKNKLDIIFNKEWADWSGGDYILSTSVQGMLNVFGLTCDTGSLIMVQMQVDIAAEALAAGTYNPGPAYFFPSINGTQPAGLRGQLVWNPGDVTWGYPKRVTLSGQWVFQASTAYSNAFVSISGSRVVNTANCKLFAVSGTPGVSETGSHTWIQYQVIRA